MPSVHNFSVLRETLREHPVIVATTAATGGVLLGAFVMFQVFAPTRPPENSMQTAAVTKPEPKTIAARTEPTTTGAAAAGDSTAAADCDQQTWPNLSRPCMEQMREKNRAARVVITDKPPVTTTENAQPAEMQRVASAPIASAVAAVTPPLEPVPAVSPPAPVSDPAPSVALAVATPEPAPTEMTPQTPAQAAVKALKAERARNKSKIKGEPKAVVRRDFNETSDGSVASYADDDRDVDNRDVRAERRADRSRRIVERWTERDYDVRSDDGDGQRRVTVIRRARSAGPFEALFGIGRDDD